MKTFAISLAILPRLNLPTILRDKGPDDQPQLSEAGKNAAAAGRCASCHGDDFAGSKATARIAGQREEYIAKALHDYKSGARSGGGVAAMAEATYPLTDQDISALAHYLAWF